MGCKFHYAVFVNIKCGLKITYELIRRRSINCPHTIHKHLHKTKFFIIVKPKSHKKNNLLTPCSKGYKIIYEVALWSNVKFIHSYIEKRHGIILPLFFTIKRNFLFRHVENIFHELVYKYSLQNSYAIFVLWHIISFREERLQIRNINRMLS